jgi:glycosyltransferase involved in cell wall biosynthesis
MGAAKAVVSTTVGAEGLDVSDGRDIVLADTPDRFAAAVIRLLQHAPERRRLEDEALSTASRYDWSVVAGRLESILAAAVQSSPLARARSVPGDVGDLGQIYAP